MSIIAVYFYFFHDGKLDTKFFAYVLNNKGAWFRFLALELIAREPDDNQTFFSAAFVQLD